MFETLERINRRPAVWSQYTAAQLWNDEHTSKQMLAFHLNPDVDISSRNRAFIDRSVDWMQRRFDLGEGSRVCDFGCGPGLYTSRFAALGAQVTGIDFSTRSIRYARQQAEAASLPIQYVNQNYLQFESNERYDLITLLMCDFCALNPQQRQQLLARFHALLDDAGHVVFDVYSLAGFAARAESAAYAPNLMDGFWAEEAYFGFHNTFLYPDEQVALDQFVLFTQEREWEVYNWLQYFSSEALRQEVESAGFKIEALLGDAAGGEYDQNNSEFAVVLSKG
ncbi:class I SAM-dependent methyltransferase [Marinobacterium sp. AK62]|uniref:Class I SAM-dependent methyltransferase n=1 Tax=Marinobacterium alkalitolerans TaxID=1542925 RepID=A0ABS3ZC32_9GAMM|nr:class I SAM-dependent methyltransferase [Marinobacterium alkalitolerans]MBP0049270.1 class I SAM-dependent methyltransferase [Marinobacterium alkalitolerans]